MATYAPEKLSTHIRAVDTIPQGQLRANDWSPVFLEDDLMDSSLSRSRSARQSGRTRDSRNGKWANFDDYERRDAAYKEANALQPRWTFHHQRAQSEDTRRPKFRRQQSDKALAPGTFVSQRPSSDPEIPRFEELPDDKTELSLSDRGASEDKSDADEYEAPPTLLGQAQDCMRVLAKAADRSKASNKSTSEAAATQRSEISSQCEDLLFRLKVWISEANIGEMPAMVDNELDGEVIALVSSILYRLHARAELLTRAIKRTRKNRHASFSFAAPLQQDIDEDLSGSESDSRLPSAEHLTPAVEVQQHLKQVDLQIRTLRRLARSVRVAQKDDISMAIVHHVAQVTHLFGDAKDCERWRGEVQGMPGDAALRKVKELAGVCG